MKRTLRLTPVLVVLGLAVGTFTPAAHAQEHQHADTTRAMPMDHGTMNMESMMPKMMAMPR